MNPDTIGGYVGEVKSLIVSIDGYTETEMPIAATPLARLRGWRGPRVDGALAVRTCSIHTFGLAEAINVLAIDSEGVVVAAERVVPRRIRIYPRATMILELSERHPLPAVGTVVVTRHG